MATISSAKPPWTFTLYAVVTVLWGLAGVYACYSQLTVSAAQLATMPPVQREAFTAMPPAVRMAYVVAVTGGLVGALMLLLRRRQARIAFVVSLLGLVVQFGWTFIVFRGLERLGPLAWAFPAFIFGVTASEIWLAGLALERVWLR